MKLGFKPNLVLEAVFILAAALVAWALHLPAYGIVAVIIGAYALVFVYETTLDNRHQRERAEIRRSRRQTNSELYGWPDLNAPKPATGGELQPDGDESERPSVQPTLERLAAEKSEPEPTGESEVEEAIAAPPEPRTEAERTLESEIPREHEIESAPPAPLVEEPAASSAEPEPVSVEEPVLALEATVVVETMPEPEPQVTPEPEPEAAPELELEPEPAIAPERGSRLAVIASRADIASPASEQAIGGWNVWELERLVASRKGKDDESDYERQLLLVYLREFASSDGRLPSELDALVREAFGDLVRAPSGR
jgi:hypothetical protein